MTRPDRRSLPIAAILVAACSGTPTPAERTEGFGLQVRESAISARVEGLTLQATFELAPTTARSRAGELIVELRPLGDAGDGEPLASGSTRFVAEGEPARPTVALALSDQLADVSALAGYVLRYRVVVAEGELYGYRSAFDILAVQAVQVVGDDRHAPDKPKLLRVSVTDRKRGAAIAGEAVTVSFAREDGEPRVVAQGATDARGDFRPPLTFTDADLGRGQLVVSTAGHFSRHPVIVERPQQILLTTDKPLYQPGQRVHLRALAMSQPEVAPLRNTPLELVVLDPKGNQILKQQLRTDGYGIAAHSFDLADRVNQGLYTVRVGGEESARVKTFTVARYRLPKFKVTVAADRPYFKSGEPITGEVVAQYYFGQPVADAQVKLSVSLAAPVQPGAASAPADRLKEIIGTTDAAGRYAFALELGVTGAVALDAEVTDATTASARGSLLAQVGDGGAVLQVIAEPSTVVQGQQATLYVVLSDPAGKPLAGQVQLSNAIDKLVEVPASGIATVRATVNYCQVPYDPGAAPAGPAAGGFGGAEMDMAPGAPAYYGGPLQARFGDTSVSLPLDCTGSSGFALATDKALYREGEIARLTIAAPASVQRAALEVLRADAPILRREVTVEDGAAQLELPLDSTLTRTLTLRLLAQHEEQSLLAQKLIYVAGADRLSVALESDRPLYRPGDEAKVVLRVTDHQGRAAPAALGVQVVDEAVYGLSEVKAGIERSFFATTDEVVDASQQLRFIGPEALLVDEPQALDQLRARVLFAAAGDRARMPIDFGGRQALNQRALAVSQTRLATLASKLQTALLAAENDAAETIWLSREATGQRAIARFVAAPENHDGFGQQPRAEQAEHDRVLLSSAGMDERWGTEDDLQTQLYAAQRGAFDGAAAGMAPNAGAEPAPPGGNGSVAPTDPSDPSRPAGPSGVRQYFPETLHVDPALITDGQGRAELDLALADSITNWKLTAIAHTLSGQLGSATGGLTAFQPFFIDALLPAQLMQGDEVSVPIAVYNYLDAAQQVQVELTEEPWFTLLDSAAKQVPVGARSVASVSFRIRIEQVGRFALTAAGRSAEDSDAVRRSVVVEPDGQLTGLARSGLLKPGTASHQVTIPANAIEGGSELKVKVFPGMTAQVVEGFEGMLRQPNGCFEQTSSSTYPNVMVLSYLQKTGQVTAAVEARAKAYIATGYQRLLTFEIDGGGFSLWGTPPASQTLSAFGLMQFADMAKVHAVDSAMIARTRAWLLARQQSSGAFPLGDETAHQTSGSATSSQVLSTAYVAWALAESGTTGAALDKALAYLRQHAGEVDGAYGVALVATALVSANPDDPAAGGLLDKLESMAQTSGDKASWSSTEQSLTYGYGDSMQIETTALALNALLKGQRKTPRIGQGVAFLASKRDALGAFGTTQSTALALRALLLAHQRAAEDDTGGTVLLTVDGVEHARIDLDAASADVTRIVDLDQLASGTRKIAVDFVGRGEIGYQVAGHYWVPHTASTQSGPLSLSVSYDREQLSVGQSLSANVTVAYSGSKALPSPMIHLGLPPGFTADGDALVEQTNGLIQSVELRGAHLVLYLANLSGSRSFQVPLRAGLPVKGKAPASSAYAYYTPELQVVAQTPVVSVYPASN